VIASGNHLLTQVKDNQPSLRRRLELGVAGRKPSGSAKTETAGRIPAPIQPRATEVKASYRRSLERESPRSRALAAPRSHVRIIDRSALISCLR
jgi:hypothetical protein